MACEMNGCSWSEDMEMCSDGESGMVMGQTPHFISIDEENGYWFVTLMNSGYVSQYDLYTDTLISSLELGDLPALSSIDQFEKKIYISRMNMPNMPIMNAETNVINVVSYSEFGLVLEDAIDICHACEHGIGPHAIAFDPLNNNVYTASVNSDYLFKVNIGTNNIDFVSLDGDGGTNPNLIKLKYKPIQCSFVDNYIFVTCSGGTWENGENDEEISGQIQMYDLESLELIDIYNFSSDATPWHIISDENNSRIYVALSGQMMMQVGQGVACLGYSSDGLSIIWHYDDPDNIMDDPHGLDLSHNSNKLFVSDRGNGSLYTLSTVSGQVIDQIDLSVVDIGSSTQLGGVAAMRSSIQHHCPLCTND